MANLRNLSPSHIRYLLTMQELDRQGKGVRSSDIAAALGLSKPSVHNMMKTFMDREKSWRTSSRQASSAPQRPCTRTGCL